MKLLINSIKIIVLSLFVASCVYTQKINSDFISIKNYNENRTYTELNFNGFYHRLDKEAFNFPVESYQGKTTKYIDTIYALRPLMFFKDGNIMYSYLYYAYQEDMILLKKSNIKLGYQKWGVYKIIYLISTFYDNWDLYSEIGAYKWEQRLSKLNLNGIYASQAIERLDNANAYIRSFVRELHFSKFPHNPITDAGNIVPLKIW